MVAEQLDHFRDLNKLCILFPELFKDKWIQECLKDLNMRDVSNLSFKLNPVC